MGYTIYFGIEGEFVLPGDFFVAEVTEEKKARIAEIEALGLDMTLRQKAELDDLKAKGDVTKNAYGMNVHTLPKDQRLSKATDKLPLGDYLLFDPETESGFICFRNEDRQFIELKKNGDHFIPVNIPYAINDRMGQVDIIEQIIDKCKLNLTILDRGDEEYGYVEDGCDRELEHRIFKDGIYVETVTE